MNVWAVELNGKEERGRSDLGVVILRPGSVPSDLFEVSCWALKC
jgi:hypothetical protein